MSETRSLPRTSPHPPPPTAGLDGGPPVVPFSTRRNYETLDPSSKSPEAGPSHVSPQNYESIPPQLIGAMEVPHCEINQLSHLHEPDRHDGIIADPSLATTDHGAHLNGYSTVQPPGEMTCVDGSTLVDSRSHVDSRPGGSAPCVKSSPQFLTAEHPLSCSALAQISRSLETNAPRADTNRPSSGSTSSPSEMPDANQILSPDKSVPTSRRPLDIAAGCPPVIPRGSDGLHHLPLPRPPPEVTALLTAQSVSDVVSPVFARNSRLVPWELPSEIGHFWLGLFKISEVKVTHACPRFATDLTSLWVYLFARWKHVHCEAPQTH